MASPALEVADIFRDHGAAWRHANRDGVSLDQLKVMSAIENCRTAALGGHVARCEDCAHTVIALNEQSVTFKVKDYRIEGPGRYTTMTLDVGEFIRRFLIHVLPKGFHRIRHYGLFASSNRTKTMEAVRKLLDLAPSAAEQMSDTQPLAHPWGG
jgi:hypothetical protein